MPSPKRKLKEVWCNEINSWVKQKEGDIKPDRNDFDKVLFEDLCAIHCTQTEILHILRTDPTTLEHWCYRVYGWPLGYAIERLSADGKCSLRRAQWKAALESGSERMMIHLGKHILGQHDKVEGDFRMTSANAIVQQEIDITPEAFQEALLYDKSMGEYGESDDSPEGG